MEHACWLAVQYRDWISSSDKVANRTVVFEKRSKFRYFISRDRSKMTECVRFSGKINSNRSATVLDKERHVSVVREETS
jgi:hypothetical protein